MITSTPLTLQTNVSSDPRLCHLSDSLELSLWPLSNPSEVPGKAVSEAPAPFVGSHKGQHLSHSPVQGSKQSSPETLPYKLLLPWSTQGEVSGSQAKFSGQARGTFSGPQRLLTQKSLQDAFMASWSVYRSSNGHKNGKKMNPLKSDPISLHSLNINAVHSDTGKPMRLVKPALTTRCRQTVARRLRLTGPTQIRSDASVKAAHGRMHLEQPPTGGTISTLLDHLVASRCKDWAAARMGWLTGWLDGINSSSGS